MAKSVSIDPSRLLRHTAASAEAVTPNDATDLPNLALAGLLVTVTGNVKFNDAQGNAVTLAAVPVFTRIPIAASRVWATGTSATVLALN